MFIRSERLFLRPGWPEDWRELLALISDRALIRNLAGAPWPYTGEDARAFLALPQEALRPRFLVTVPNARGARLVGAIGLGHACEDAVPDAALGYWIARDHRGRGYASEAVGAVVQLARTLGHRRIVASHFVDNPASGRVLEKSGFRRTGPTVQRHSAARGAGCPARQYALDLTAPGDCDDLGDDMRRRHAA